MAIFIGGGIALYKNAVPNYGLPSTGIPLEPQTKSNCTSAEKVPSGERANATSLAVGFMVAGADLNRRPLGYAIWLTFR